MDPPPKHPQSALHISGVLARSDIPQLCDRARPLLVGCDERAPLVCDVGELMVCDAVAVDALAHLQLLAGRYGSEIRVVGASETLADLIALAGLSDVLKVGRA